MWEFLYKYFNPYTAWQGYNLYGGYIVTGKVDPKTLEGIAFTLFKSRVREKEGELKNTLGQHVAYLDNLGFATGGIGHLLTVADRLKYPKQYDTKRSGVDAKGRARPMTSYSKNSASVIPTATVDAWFIADCGSMFNAGKAQALQLKKYTVDMIVALSLVCYQQGPAWNTEKFPNTWKLMVKGDTASIKAAINAIEKSAWATQQTPDRAREFVAAIKRNYGVA